MPEFGQLIAELEANRWTGRPGYGVKTLLGACLVKHVFALPTWTRVTALIGEHWRLQRALGCEGDPPSHWSLYRFVRKLRENGESVERCIDSVVEGLKAKLPDYGTDLAVDASDMPAFANGQRYLSKNGPERDRYSDPDASWGHRSAVSTRKGGGFYGYRLHLAACTKTGLPVAWQVETARANESNFVTSLLDSAKGRGALAVTVAMDKAYDMTRVYEECAERGCEAIVPLRQTTAVKRGEHRPPTCSHGEWKFAGADRRRGATKWRCPAGKCAPASTWIKADRLHPLIPRETERWYRLYRGRGAVEREFGRLKHSWGLKPLRVRGLDRVRLHADLTVLTKLACALSRARSYSISNNRSRTCTPTTSASRATASSRGQRAPRS
jgi:hypothetical protein